MVLAYLRERFPLTLYVPLALALAASWLPPLGGSTALGGSLFALLLLLQFRMWDDLADRHRDAVTHPERVLVRASDVTQIIALCCALAVLNVCLAVWRDASGIAVAVLAGLDALFAAWYLARPAGRTVLGDQLLLAKYPAMVAIVGGSRLATSPVPVLAAAAVIYLGACVYEAWHDRSSPLARYLSIGGH